ncbi:autotransporter outer membrane beta-barrel domain-containing protein, partial [Chelativorans sp.]|uniref:autotransporter outer membrane beta-barrel domain-containing protein n=1 Tax=Chelativorans sp. TaxID=2203393 RepID=UPI0028115F37
MGGSGYFVGDGGTGGKGLWFTDGGVQVVIDSLVQGGTGGVPGPLGAPVAASGEGIVGQNLDLVISTNGRVASGGPGANAIEFTGGSVNGLELHDGSLITGNVVAGGSLDNFRLGGTGNGTFDVSSIGAAQQYRGFESFQKVGTSTWTLTGENSTDPTSWQILQGTLSVGASGALGSHASSTLTIDGGTLQTTGASGITYGRSVTIGANNGTIETVGDLTLSGVVSGPGSLTKIGAGTLALSGDNSGFAGDVTVSEGTLEIAGQLGSENGTIDYTGGDPDATATVRISGPDAAWTSGLILVADSNSGELIIEDGGRLSVALAAVAGNLGGVGSVVVSGAGSIWQSSAGFSIGHYGNGRVFIADGGNVVSDALVVIGGATYGTGTVEISGSGSLLAGEAIYVGLQGNGTLTLAEGGTASVRQPTLTLAMDERSFGTLNFGAASGAAARASGTLDAMSVTFGPGTGTIVFNHTGHPDGSDLIFASSLIGSGTIRHESGTTILTADNSDFSGTAAVSGGTLLVNGSLENSTFSVEGGRLGGVGRLGPTTLSSGGTIAPGNSIGTLTVAGDYVGTGGLLEIETELGDDSSPTDLLHVTGSTSGDTDVRVINLGGSGAQTDEGIRIVQVDGSSDGAFSLLGDYVFQGEQAVVAGAYAYRLYQGSVSDPTDGDWYLRSAAVPDPDP